MTERKTWSVRDSVADILNAIGRIEAYVGDTDRDAFVASTLIQDAVIRNLEIIGEAANRIRIADPTFAQRHTELRLDLAYRMRNALIHGYDAVNALTVWNTIRNDLPCRS